MPWISNHKHEIEEKSTKCSLFSSEVVDLRLADLWEYPTLDTHPISTLSTPEVFFTERLFVLILVNIGWGNGLLADSTKPLPQPMST